MSRTKLLAKIITALERVESDVKMASATRVRLSFNPLDLLSGTPMGPQILEAIDRSDICVFEISDLNANVFFEM